MADEKLLPKAGDAYRAALDAAFREGADALLKAIRENPERYGFQPIERKPGTYDAASVSAAIRARGRKLVGETPAQKSARLRRLARIVRDEELAREMAALIRAGETTESARHKMGSQVIGIVRAQRVRALAVRLGLLEPRA